MKSISKIFVVFALIQSGPLVASQYPQDEMGRVLSFIEDNVINKVVQRSDEGTIVDGKVAYSFKRTTTFANLLRGHGNFSYDAIINIEQTNWDLDEFGNKILPGQNKDRVLVERFTISKRSSTARVVGTAKTLSSTQPRWSDSVTALMLQMSGEKLVIKSTSTLYEDYFDVGGGYYPGAADFRSEYSIEEGVLKIQSKLEKVYKVDPETLERNLHYTRDELMFEKEINKLAID